MFRLIYVKASFFFFFIERKKRGNRIRNTTARSNDPFGERESVSLARRNLSNFPSPPFSSSKTFVDEKETKTGRKRWRGKKKKKDGEGEGGSDMHRCVYRPFQIGRLGWRWYLEKKHEMIDDRPILVATYGVPYPPGCSYNGHCSNLFPPSWRCHVPDVIWEQIST